MPRHIPEAFTENIEFHMDVIRCGGCPSVADELGKVWFRRMMRFSWLKLTHFKLSMENCHQKLAEAFMARDPDRAEAVMREHVRYSSEEDQEALRGLTPEKTPRQRNKAGVASQR